MNCGAAQVKYTGRILVINHVVMFFHARIRPYCTRCIIKIDQKVMLIIMYRVRKDKKIQKRYLNGITFLLCHLGQFTTNYYSSYLASNVYSGNSITSRKSIIQISSTLHWQCLNYKQIPIPDVTEYNGLLCPCFYPKLSSVTFPSLVW